MDINSLERFVAAQEHKYEAALNEIKKGKKRTHWMWYVFPQLRGLGMSEKSYIYGISGVEEAKAYLAHPVLSARLIEISRAILTHKGKNIYEILGDIDAEKLQSSMSLFAAISEDRSVFHQVLDCFYGGEPDKQTLKRIKMN